MTFWKKLNQYIRKHLISLFDNKDIKNIAITGIYGAGKSTVWKSYAAKKKLKNIIAVSLGKYEDNTPEFGNPNVD